MKLVLVTGSQDWTNMMCIMNAIRDAKLVIHGDAAGADTIARIVCGMHSIPNLAVPVGKEEWKRVGKQAGPIRNHRMVRFAIDFKRLGYVPECHAFPLPQSRGTIDCMQAARDAGIPVFEHKS